MSKIYKMKHYFPMYEYEPHRSKWIKLDIMVAYEKYFEGYELIWCP